MYDPFIRGRFPVGVRTFEALDPARNRRFPCEIWYPAAAQYAGRDLAAETQDVFSAPPGGTPHKQAAVRDAAVRPGTYPLIVYSHHSGGHRRAATFLSTHLASHGYVVAALDHSEVVAPELARRNDETGEQRAARIEAVVANRVPDIRFLLDHMLGGSVVAQGGSDWNPEATLDPAQIGIVGHSLGGWTVLATPDVDSRIRAVVALAPGGSANPRPGIIRAKLNFAWGRDVPTLYLVADLDTPLPLAGIHELFQRTPATRQMVILRRADHLHFIDDVEQMHEASRAIPMPGELSYIAEEMLPIAELCSARQAHLFVRGLTLCHLDATLRQQAEARNYLAGDICGQLAQRGVEAALP